MTDALTDAVLPQALTHHPLVEKLGWVLLHFLWEGALVAGVLALALVLLRRRPPSERYAASLAALAVMAALPVLTWQVLPPAAPSAETAPGIRVLMRLGPPPSVDPAPPGVTVLSAEPLPATEAARPSLGEGGPLAALVSWMHRRAGQGAPLVALGWLVGVAVLALRTAGGWAYVFRLKRDAAPPPEPWRQRFRALAREMGLVETGLVGRSPQLLVASRAEGPSAVGWWRPAVLVPTGFLAGLPPAQVEAILRHELAHIRRHDYVVGLAQTALETLLFYHPAVWWVSGRVRTLREHCCDDSAASAGADISAKGRLTYARALAALEDWQREGQQAPAIAPAATGGSLLARIRRLVGQETAPVRTFGGPTAAALVVLLALGACAAGAATQQPEAAERDAPAPEQEREAAPPPPAPPPPAALDPDTLAASERVPTQADSLAGLTEQLRAQAFRFDTLETPDADAWQEWAKRQEEWTEKWQAWGEHWQEQMEDAPQWQAWRERMEHWADSLRTALPDRPASPDSLSSFFQDTPRVPAPPAFPQDVLEDVPAPPAFADPPPFPSALDSLRGQIIRPDTLPEGFAPEALVRIFPKDDAERRTLAETAERLAARAEALAEEGRAEAARALREESQRLRQQRERLDERRQQVQEHRERMKEHRRRLERHRERLEERQRKRQEEVEERVRERREEVQQRQREVLRERAAELRARAGEHETEAEALHQRIEALQGEDASEERLNALRRRAETREKQALTLRQQSRQLRRQAGQMERDSAAGDQMQDID